MHLPWAVTLPRGPRSAVEGVVAGERLAGAGGGEHREENGEVVEPLDAFLDSHQCHVDAWQRCGEPGIPFVFGDRDLAGLGDEEIAAGDSHVGLDVEPAHVAPGDHRQLLGAFCRRTAEMLLEELADLATADMHAGEDEMERGLAAELLDELPEVTFYHAVALGLEGVVQVDLLGRHALALDDRLRSGRADDLEDDRARFGRVARPVHFAAAGLEAVGEEDEHLVEPVDGVPLGEVGGVAGVLPVAVAGLLAVARRVIAGQGTAEERAVIGVADVLAGVVEESLLGTVRRGFRPAGGIDGMVGAGRRGWRGMGGHGGCSGGVAAGRPDR